ncbi:MAG: DUF1254 domain-containing protein [Pseudomonadota bacterium]
MKSWLAPLCVAAAFAVTSHLAIIYSAPDLIMGRAMAMIEGRGAQLHQFFLAERTTPQTQSVVRPSPDLAYSVCLFDLDEASQGLQVTMAETQRYSSLSFFDASTVNFRTIRGDGDAVDVRLLPPGVSSNDSEAIIAPTTKGLILIRRLAPTLADYRNVVEIAADDACDPLS